MILSLVLTILKLVPSLKGWWDELVSAYVYSEIATINKENLASVRKAILEQDQRDLERAIGNPYAGERSNIPGSEIVNSLPGVKP